MKNIFIVSLILSLAIISGCASSTSGINSQSSNAEIQQIEAVFVDVKYRNDPVDLASFEYLNTASSSFVGGAWYDVSEQYMVINLNGIYYHYCELPLYVWNDFKGASSFGSYYNSFIKGEYDCRVSYLPSYR